MRHPCSCVLCPGMHAPSLTADFVAGLDLPTEVADRLRVFPSQVDPAYSPHHLLRFVQAQVAQTTPLVFIGFSAGVVGAIGAARLWQRQGGTMRALIAVDGWGVPLSGDFPIHRVSHDAFTDWSSSLLGMGQDRFYADPAVGHLDLWRSPHTAGGWWVESGANSPSRQTTAASFITALLKRYEVSGFAIKGTD